MSKAETKKTAASTKTKSSAKKVTRKKNSVDPVTIVTDDNKPDETAATYGNPAEVDGIEGYIVTGVSYDKTGFPDQVLFRPRKNGNSLMTVKYSDVKALLNGYR